MYDDNTTPQLWPPFIEQKFIERTLGYYHNGILHLEGKQGHTQRVPTELSALPDALFSHNVLCFVESLVPLRGLISSRGGSIFCNKEGIEVSAKLTGKRKTTRWIVVSSSWGYPTPGPLMLQHLRAFFTHVQVGTPVSPGATGQATMRKVWGDTYGHNWTKHRHQRPPSWVCEELYENVNGGRSELLNMSQHFSSIIELDQKNAYAHAFRKLPTGPCVRFWTKVTDGWEMVKDIACWVGHCLVRVKEKLKYGPFPYKISQEGKKVTTYPTEPGDYSCWLWKPEAELCKEEGCEVLIQDGYGWLDMTEEPNEWVKYVSLLRDTAKEQSTEDLVKQMIVAAIGRHGMRPERYELVEEQLDESDTMATGSERRRNGVYGWGYAWWIHKSRDEFPTELPHWMHYCLALCRVSLFRVNKPFVLAEWSVATQVDATFQKEEALDIIKALYKPKHEKRETGEYGYRVLHPKKGLPHVEFTAIGNYNSEEKTRTQGSPRRDSG